MESRFYKTVVEAMFESIREEAEKKQICKRKAVGCAILKFSKWGSGVESVRSINGPSHQNNECTNEIGNCGCAHAEPRAILKFLQTMTKGPDDKVLLLTTFSSCTPCANLIVEAGFIDAVAYEIFAPHWARADVILRNVMPVWTREELTEEVLHDFITK